jgi:hypothetical protein
VSVEINFESLVTNIYDWLVWFIQRPVLAVIC